MTIIMIIRMYDYEVQEKKNVVWVAINSQGISMAAC
jgi:hypothetical protein